MAKSPKSPPRKKRTPANSKPKPVSKPKAEVIEAEIVEDAVTPDPADVAAKESKAPDPAADAAKFEGTASEAIEDATDTPAPETDKPAETPSLFVAEEPRSGGFFPSILGGVIAGALGFGAALLIFPEGWREKDDTLVTKLQTGLSEQQEKLTDLTGQVGDLGGRVGDDIDALKAELAEKATAVTGLRERLENLTKGDGSVALPEDVQLLLNAQKEQISSLSAEVAAMAATAKAQMEAALAQEETAEQAEARVKARGAMQEIRLALVSGEPFADALVNVAPAVDVPEGLQAVAADGAPTAAEVQQEFPAAARKALAQAVRAEAGDDTQSRLQLFLKDQLGARSLTPQEGDSGDAVLSRAEAAVKAEDLATALSEIEALPEAALAELADWQAKAQARMAAVDGFEAVSDALNGN